LWHVGFFGNAKARRKGLVLLRKTIQGKGVLAILSQAIDCRVELMSE